MNTKDIATIREALQKTLNVFALRHGLKSVTVGKALYAAGTVEFRVECVQKGALSLEENQYEQLRERTTHPNMPLPPLGHVITLSGISKAVVGATSTGRRCIVAAEDGVRYTIDTDALRVAYRKQQGKA